MLIILLFSFKLEGQYHFDFEIDSSGMGNCSLESGWIQVPEQRWCKDTIAPISGSSSLHHSFDNPQEGTDYLVFRHDPLNVSFPFSFSFRIRHGYLPSNMNNWQLALGATLDKGQEPGGEEAHIRKGIVLGVNYSGSDDLLKIWLVDEGISEILCSTALNYQELAGDSLAPLFLIQGDGVGNLDLFWSPDPAGQASEHLATCRIDGLAWGRQLLVRYRYTSSRDRALWLDELVMEGHFEKDTTAPELTSLELVNDSSLQLGFSETVHISEAGSFVLYSEDLPEGQTPTGIRELEEKVLITFSEVFPMRKHYRLLIEGVEDPDGNRMADTAVCILRNEALWGDVVFNEIMVDPDPAIRYGEEYLELYNRSEYAVDLEGWQLYVNEKTFFLDATYMRMEGDIKREGDIGIEGHIRIEGDVRKEEMGMELIPGAYICLGGITLPNDGATLALYSKEGRLVHASSFRLPWNGPDWKKDGGWSLESPDADLVCRISANWEYSMDPGGGTPGRPNSNQVLLEDKELPVFLYAGVGDPGELKLHYNEALQTQQNLGAAFRLDPGAIFPDSVLLVDPLRETLQLYFQEDFQEWAQYRMNLPGLSDCAGNRSPEQVLRAGAISLPVPGSVQINEIMYDPEEGKPEYIELFVPGNRVLDLQDLAIHLVEEGGSPDRPLALSSHSRLILPGQYLVLTKCVPHLEEAYNLEVSGCWVEMAGLPGLNNSSGSIYLTDRAGQVLDMVSYNEEMHMELLDDPRGISLERVSGERPGNDPENWHSAASIEGYATPGRKNSQSHAMLDGEQLLTVSPEVFSPDNDGYQDLLQININTGGNDWIIGLFITDLQGRLIRTLANNHLAAPSVSYFWNGEGEDGSMMPMGFYVLHARAYRPATGAQWIRRKAVGLVYR